MRLRISPMKWTSRALLGPRIPTLVPSLEMVSKPPYRPKTYQATKPPISPRRFGHLSNNPTGRPNCHHNNSPITRHNTTRHKTTRHNNSPITRRKIILRRTTHRRTTHPRTIRLCFRPLKTAARCPQAMDTAKPKIQLIRPATIASRLPTLCRLGLDEHLHCFLAQSIAV
jgi:hypothetical protein